MATGYILYNPTAGNGEALSDLPLLEIVMDADIVQEDITKIEDYSTFLGKLEKATFWSSPAATER